MALEKERRFWNYLRELDDIIVRAKQPPAPVIRGMDGQTLAIKLKNVYDKTIDTQGEAGLPDQREKAMKADFTDDQIDSQRVSKIIHGEAVPTLDSNLARMNDYAFADPQVTEGKKDAAGKLDWSILPYESLIGVVRVFEKGSAHYKGRRTWLPGIMFSSLFAAIMRHLLDWFVFMKDKDKDSGEHPLCHVIANCMMILTYVNDKHFDNR